MKIAAVALLYLYYLFSISDILQVYTNADEYI